MVLSMLLMITFGIHDMSQKDELAPNVMAMVQSFNRLALLVPTEILEEKTPQARSKVITSFIQVREEVPIPFAFTISDFIPLVKCTISQLHALPCIDMVTQSKLVQTRSHPH